MEDLFIGVDVGTGSARAALVTGRGQVLATASRSIQIWSPKPGYAEQSSRDIWDSICQATKEILKGQDEKTVKGIGFDATCSMVALDNNGEPVSVSPSGDKERNIIMWMDHRAEAEVTKVNNTKHQVLKFVGGKISLEMQVPKLLWLKNNFGSDYFNKVAHFFDLPDFLTWKATGKTSRSLCSLVCKWTYQVDEKGQGFWARDFFDQIGLGAVLKNEQIGTDVRMPGSFLGHLTSKAAAELGLTTGVKVGTSLIDAHAGTLGMLGCSAPNTTQDFSARLGLICGTSSCHMALSSKSLFVYGVWGPYYSAVLPNMWLTEGGQSACGRLIDHIIDSHPASSKFKHLERNAIPVELNRLLETREGNSAFLTEDIHIVPDFHGNRSPLADASRKGMISGLDLDTSETSLSIIYLATIQAIAYGTKHIFETLQKHGHNLKVALVCGGLGKNPLFVQTIADVLEMPVLLPEETESVLLGAAILGATAAGKYSSVQQAATSMGGKAKRIEPDAVTAKFHKRKYKVFLKMLSDQTNYRKIMLGED